MSSRASLAKAVGVRWKADETGWNALVESSAPFGTQQNSVSVAVLRWTEMAGFEEEHADLRERLLAGDLTI